MDATNTLKTLVQSFASATDTAARNSLVDQIIYKWTNSNAIDPNSGEGYFDARKLLLAA